MMNRLSRVGPCPIRLLKRDHMLKVLGLREHWVLRDKRLVLQLLPGGLAILGAPRKALQELVPTLFVELCEELVGKHEGM
eukprot:16092091-Heterocapsa_arctica.AAC.1